MNIFSGKLNKLHNYGLFESNNYTILSRNKSPLLIKFTKFSSRNHKKIVKNIQHYVFYIFTPTVLTDMLKRYSLNDILALLNNDKLLFVEFIQQMNIYFNERQIIHNNFFSMEEINEILIHIYIDELIQPRNPVINNTIETILDMVDDKKTVNDLIDMETVVKTPNPFSQFMFTEEPSKEEPKKINNQPPVKYHNEPLLSTKPSIQSSSLYKDTRNKKNVYKKKSIPLVLKRRLWDKYFGEKNGIAMCPCCKMTQISTFSFHCGHIVSERNGGALILDNLIPICQSCNSSMGTKSYNEFCESIGISNDIIF